MRRHGGRGWTQLDARPPLTTEADGARRLVALLGPSLHLTVAHAIGHNSGAIGRLRAHRQTQAATRRRKESHHRNFRKPSMGTAVRAMVFGFGKKKAVVKGRVEIFEAASSSELVFANLARDDLEEKRVKAAALACSLNANCTQGGVKSSGEEE